MVCDMTLAAGYDVILASIIITVLEIGKKWDGLISAKMV